MCLFELVTLNEPINRLLLDTIKGAAAFIVYLRRSARRRMEMKRFIFLSIVVLFLPCLFLLSNQARGADWRLVVKSTGGNVSVSVDNSSVRWVSEDIVKSCQRFSYARPRLLNSAQKPVKEIVAYREWNCSEDTYNDVKVTFCYADGTKETENYKYALWHQVKQNSPEDYLQDYVCGHE